MAGLHTDSSVYSARHVPTWIGLAFAAGAVNAGSYLACTRFVTHVTGTATLLGLNEGKWVLVFDYLLVLVSFVIGAMSAVLCIEARVHRGKSPLYALPLLIVVADLLFVSIGGRLGWFSPWGLTVDTMGDFVMLSVLAYAMGLQNAAAASTTNMAIRTTHMTGTATDLGVSLMSAYFALGNDRLKALRVAGLRAAKLTAFIIGAMVMVPLARAFQYLAFLLPAVVVALCAAASFVPKWLPSDDEDPESLRER